jgi:(1->4)-alpha-D-glucan 1-alpha-D-glucosylmutase
VRAFVERILEHTPNNAFLADFRVFAAKIAHYGAFNALSQTLLKLTSPGVPDIYQGNDLWDLSLVDPDNRRPVDYAHHADLLRSLDQQINSPKADVPALVRDLVENKASGCIKLYVIARTLRLRREQPALFAVGSYHPLEAAGPHAEQIVAFARRHAGAEIVVATPRLVTRLAGEAAAPIGNVWSGDLLVLPDTAPGTRYTQLFTDEHIEAIEQGGKRGLPLAAVFAHAPIALLIKDKLDDENLAR